jgi:hypothetical protein
MLLLRGEKPELLAVAVVVVLERRRKGMLGSMKVENFQLLVVWAEEGWAGRAMIEGGAVRRG